MTVELTDEELFALRVALGLLVQDATPGPAHDRWRTAATGVLQRILPLVSLS